jgi:hypothetical protein
MRRPFARRDPIGLALSGPVATLARPASAAPPTGVIRITPQGAAPVVYDLARGRDAGDYHGAGDLARER